MSRKAIHADKRPELSAGTKSPTQARRSQPKELVRLAPHLQERAKSQQSETSFLSAIGAFVGLCAMWAVGLGVFIGIGAVINHFDKPDATPTLPASTPADSASFDECMRFADGDEDAEYYARLDYCTRTTMGDGLLNEPENQYDIDYPSRP